MGKMVTVGIVSRSELAGIGAQSEHASDSDASDDKGISVYPVSEDHVRLHVNLNKTYLGIGFASGPQRTIGTRGTDRLADLTT